LVFIKYIITLHVRVAEKISWCQNSGRIYTFIGQHLVAVATILKAIFCSYLIYLIANKNIGKL
jgi:hypothetical protein